MTHSRTVTSLRETISFVTLTFIGSNSIDTKCVLVAFISTFMAFIDVITRDQWITCIASHTFTSITANFIYTIGQYSAIIQGIIKTLIDVCDEIQNKKVIDDTAINSSTVYGEYERITTTFCIRNQPTQFIALPTSNSLYLISSISR